MKELLFSITKKDFDIDYFSGTGAGGQYRNKHQNCVRLRHRESGIMSTGQSNRDRIGNMREALRGLIDKPEFKIWLNRKVNEKIEGLTLEDKVDKMMSPENMKVEIRGRDGWTEMH